MRLKLCAIILVLLPALLFAKTGNQTTGDEYYPFEAKSYFKKVQLEGRDIEAEVRLHLRNLMPSLRNGRTGLDLVHYKESKVASHYTFEQSYDGLPIYRSNIKVNVDKKSRIYAVFISDYDTDPWKKVNLDVQDFDLENSEIYRNFVAGNLSDSQFERTIRKAIGYDFESESPLLVYHVHFRQQYGHYNRDVLFTEGSVFHVQDLNVYYRAPNATAMGKVFFPDPLTSAGVEYGLPYIDNNDADSPELTAELLDVEIDVTLTNGTYTLENSYIKIADFDPPAIAPQTSNTPEFNFTRGQFGFEEVNALYHITRYQDYIRSLGITDLVDYQIRVDVYALNDQDQSLFQPGSPVSSLLFGQGCVDDAEDADVVVHEYGHAISHSAAPGSNFGAERTAVDEGFGDYIAASYSTRIDTFRARRVFSWDGNNECWTGRNARTSKTYPTDLTGSIHLNGEMWATALMDINEELGHALADQIIFESMTNYAQNISMRDVARLLIEADSMMHNGANFCGIYPALLARGLVDSLDPDPCNFKDLSIYADAGKDTTICKNAPIRLGGDPTSIGTDKVFTWTPNQDLNDNTLEQPIATPEFDVTYRLKVQRPDGFFNDDRIDVTVISCPNPAIFVNSQAFIGGTGVMQVVFPFEFDVARVRMFDVFGRLILDEQNITDKKYEIPPNHYPAGAYIFHVQVDSKEFGKKLVKVR